MKAYHYRILLKSGSRVISQESPLKLKIANRKGASRVSSGLDLVVEVSSEEAQEW